MECVTLGHPLRRTMVYRAFKCQHNESFLYKMSTKISFSDLGLLVKAVSDAASLFVQVEEQS